MLACTARRQCTDLSSLQAPLSTELRTRPKKKIALTFPFAPTFSWLQSVRPELLLLAPSMSLSLWSRLGSEGSDQLTPMATARPRARSSWTENWLKISFSMVSSNFSVADNRFLPPPTTLWRPGGVSTESMYQAIQYQTVTLHFLAQKLLPQLSQFAITNQVPNRWRLTYALVWDFHQPRQVWD